MNATVDWPRKHLAHRVADQSCFDNMTTFNSQCAKIERYNEDIVQLTEKKLSFKFFVVELTKPRNVQIST